MKTIQALVLAGMAWSAGCADVGDVGVGSQEVSAQNQPAILPPGERAFGKTYGEWEAAWWQWTMRIPRRANPVTDTTGEHCAEGQSGDVWFLAGNYGGVTHRECTVPSGKSIYFPVVNQVWVQMLTDPPMTIADMRDYTRTAMSGAVISASIDGHPVADLNRYYEETPVFSATFGPSNTWHVSARQCAQEGSGNFVCPESVDSGYALFLSPLSPGDHTIHFEARTAGGFSLDVTYTLHVQ